MIDTNLDEIKKRYPSWLSHLGGMGLSSSYSLEEARSGDITLRRSYEGKEYLYHSSYDPVKEAQNILDRSLSSLSGSPSVIILGGLGLGYLAYEVFERLEDTRLVVCDCDWDILRIVLESRCLGVLLRSSRVYFLIDEGEAVFNNLLSSFQTSNIAYIFHKPSEIIYPVYYKKLFGLISSFKNTKEINIATSNRFEKVWSKNILKNLVDFISHRGINSLSGYYEGEACVIVAAGPSLSKNISLLKGLKGRVVIIAVDTVFQILLKHGIDPDFVIAVDPQDINKKYFEGVSSSGAILICEPSISPKIMRAYGKKLMLGSLFHLIRWVEDISERKGNIDIGGSVATAAYSVARLFACDPIVFVGLDLAYSGGQSHIRGAYFEEDWFYSSTRFSNPSMLSYKFISRLSHRFVRGYYGGVGVRTDRKFDMFRTWFESQFKKSECTIIDATEGGSYKGNCSVMSLRDFMSSYCINEREWRDFTVGIEYRLGASIMFMERVLLELEKLLVFLYSLDKDLRRGLRFADELYNLVLGSVKRGLPLSGRVFEINKELDKIELSLLRDRAMNSFISLTMQSIINEIDSNREEGLTRLERLNKDLRSARKTRILYRGIRDGILFNIRYFAYAISKLRLHLGR